MRPQLVLGLTHYQTPLSNSSGPKHVCTCSFPCNTSVNSTSGPDRLIKGYTRNCMHTMCRSEGGVTYQETHDQPHTATDHRDTAEEKYSQYMSHNCSEQSPAFCYPGSTFGINGWVA